MESSKPQTDSCIITRKIRLSIDYPTENRDERIKAYRRIYDWQRAAYKISNIIASQLYMQDQINELNYFSDDFKGKLVPKHKDKHGILLTSRRNSTYRFIVEKFKNELPSHMVNCLNTLVYKNYINDKKDYYYGKKSLRNYKEGLPLPFPPNAIFDLRYDESIKNYRFSLFKTDRLRIPFKTYLGRDANNNRIILERLLKKEYSLQTSSLAIQNSKIYLFLTLKIPKKKIYIDPTITAQLHLSFYAPVAIKFKEKDYLLGNKENYIYKRHAIQQGIHRRQKDLKESMGGKGRKQKLQGLEVFKNKEKRYVATYMHQLSGEVVKFCANYKIGKLILEEFKELNQESKEFPNVLRNWSVGSLRDKIAYKCDLNNIELEIN